MKLSSSKTTMNLSLFLTVSLVLFFNFDHFSMSIEEDTITPTHPIKDGDFLVSNGQSFKLGFFSPPNSKLRYVGIWYNNISEETVICVLNRDNPINDTSGVLAIDQRGTLVLYEKNQTLPLWSANVSSSSSLKNSKVQLLDSGNLIMVGNGAVLWQSFDHPTDTWLPNMKLGVNRRTGKDWFLSSWKSKDDPATGNIFLRIDPTGFPQFFLYKGSDPLWRGGPWTGLRWSGVPEMKRNYDFHISFVNDNDEASIVDTSITNGSVLVRTMVDESGVFLRTKWNFFTHGWSTIGNYPDEVCDNFKQCGVNSICDLYDSNNFVCKCLPGFEPNAQNEPRLRGSLGGCRRKVGVSICKSGEGFKIVQNVRLPDTRTAHANMSLNSEECRQECLKNCSCMAYANADERGFGCLIWFGDLVDIRTYSIVAQDIYVRVDALELAKYESKGRLSKHEMEAIIVVSVLITLLLILYLAYCLLKRKRRATNRGRKSLFSFPTTPTFLLENSESGKEKDEDAILDLPSFDLSVIVAATNNFADSNKLGRGGFGSVYKGMLHDGKEIAVKRLSEFSGQGSEEFKNEVLLIAKLQHRNLVRILGYSVHDHEKILIYEYLPNKSLDSFIFDEGKRSSLDWLTRQDIICGIARGILYLHQDSRLRIIHRDLNASNVLLDESMNPKISDFGMARIFRAEQIEANTNRVVGTYGYMSPEYAMQGLFSVKSDVYSFGVLLLEIITGRRNNSYYEEITSLVGFVWELWKEGRSLEIVDSELGKNYPKEQVLKCIQIGLLCVQESAVDRPTMFNIVFMLSNDTFLPSPKQPAFITRRNYNSGDPSTNEGLNSINKLTVTELEAR